MTIPYSVEAEESVVGTMLARPRVVPEVIGTLLEPHHLYVAGLRAIYKELVTRYYADEAIDALTVAEVLAKPLSRLWECSEKEVVERVRDLLERHRGVNLHQLMEHARLVKRESDYRALISVSAQLSSDVQNETRPPEELAAAVSQEAMQIATSTLLTQEIMSFEELGRRFIHEQQQLMDQRKAGIDPGVYFGLPFMDNFTHGVRPSELFFLAGEPGAGKSVLGFKACQLFAERQFKRGVKKPMAALILCLEMDEKPTASRFASSIARMDAGKIREGLTNDTELQEIVKAWKIRKGIPLFINFASNMRLSQLRALVVEAIRRHNVGLVLIDHWKYIDPDRRYSKADEEDEAKARFLKQDIAKQLNVVVLCLAHTTKAIEAREDRRPRLGDLRGSGYIAAHADWVAFVHRPFRHASQRDLDEGRVTPQDAELIFEKSRHGDEGSSAFTFEARTLSVF